MQILCSYWDSLEYLERANWLEPYTVQSSLYYEALDKAKLIYEPLEVVLANLSYLDARCLMEDLLEETEHTI